MAVIPVLWGICAPATAVADPIVVTGGQAVVAWDDPSSFRLTGAGLDLVSLFPLTATISHQRACDTGCAPGATVPLRTVFGGSTEPSLGFAILAIVNGVTCASAPGPAARPRLDRTLEFDGPPFILPDVAEVGGRRTGAFHRVIV